ncbi:tuberoinfundibular peptide of 39 residues-like [Leucoraja erinacea]|uniref:tuberoinfundibular peptide of 39 residues-like n=1 Tax=Leucoraja erinaceus TaxID=7782 RepID=UPI002453CE33|nr:tuberoinfundibular peptide of 39 residues-like [Leucoraja erinacea]XP_055487552.1 tuberoinfundibular peptide of 39 residues-like [Leucoraja erinacea]XP_055487553.1 tuberoinfundibular peptide of 39 residues-like [Leucoraja erinacea]
MEVCCCCRALLIALILSCVPPPGTGPAPASAGHIRRCVSGERGLMERVAPGVMPGPSCPSLGAGVSSGQAVWRSTVVADDVAFRERNRFLAAVQRQQWLKTMMSRLVIGQ